MMGQWGSFWQTDLTNADAILRQALALPHHHREARGAAHDSPAARPHRRGDRERHCSARAATRCRRRSSSASRARPEHGGRAEAARRRRDGDHARLPPLRVDAGALRRDRSELARRRQEGQELPRIGVAAVRRARGRRAGGRSERPRTLRPAVSARGSSRGEYGFTDADGRRPDWGRLAIDFSVLPPSMVELFRTGTDLQLAWLPRSPAAHGVSAASCRRRSPGPQVPALRPRQCARPRSRERRSVQGLRVVVRETDQVYAKHLYLLPKQPYPLRSARPSVWLVIAVPSGSRRCIYSGDGQRAHDLLPVSLEPSDVIDAYKSGIDRTLLRENLKLTPAERVTKCCPPFASQRRCADRGGPDGDDRLPPAALGSDAVACGIRHRRRFRCHRTRVGVPDGRSRPRLPPVDGQYGAAHGGAAAFSPYLRGAPRGLPFTFDVEAMRRGLNFTLTTTAGNSICWVRSPAEARTEALLPHTELRTVLELECRFVIADADPLEAGGGQTEGPRTARGAGAALA